LWKRRRIEMSNGILLDQVEWEHTSQTTIDKIKAQGITTVQQLLQYDARMLVEKTGMGEKTVQKVVEQAMKQYGVNYTKGTDVLEKQRQRTHMSTGSQALDNLLGGGIESDGITELIGEFSSSKTQMCFTVSVLAVNTPPDEDGRPPHVIFIDCENTFNAKRVHQIAEMRGYNPDTTLERILVANAYNSVHQNILINNLDIPLTKNNIVMVVVDGMLSHLRGEYVGRENLSPRQQFLGGMLGKLLRIATGNHIPVIITNQVQGNPTTFGSPFKPAGGHVMAHACTWRIMLYKGAGNTRVIRVIDASGIPDNVKVRISVTDAGIVDEDGSYPTLDSYEEEEGEE
jgi:DNA repair protein RadA